jgi:hypothetical protein
VLISTYENRAFSLTDIYRCINLYRWHVSARNHQAIIRSHQQITNTKMEKSVVKKFYCEE